MVTLTHSLLHHSSAVTIPTLSKARGLPMLVTSEAPGTGATHVTIVTTVNTRHPAHRGQLLLYPGLSSESLYWRPGCTGAPGYNLGPGALPASRLTHKALIT